jgi:hypothetical protein
MLMDTPDMENGLAGAKELVNHKYGVEGDEIDVVTKNLMRVDAGAARREITSMKSEIKLPEKVNVETLTTQQKELREGQLTALKNDWKVVADKVAENFEDIVYSDSEGKELFRYSAGKDFPTDMVDSVVNNMARAGIVVDESSVNAVSEAFNKEFLYRNRDNIIKAVREDTLAKAEEKRLKEQHNPGTKKEETPPPDLGEKTVGEKIITDLETGGWQPSKPF